ncbi:haloacid dehalogenase type II [Alicyclobacillus fastidiosus]|uniref:Haloacid dehalogenase type II n=1 Tax=Alicyclobacillus fastidiosus TaxID=392011 RepID=A0ABV5AC84_9BACL|nr:haloacid dehalogenase type II [Alicyclobacillus fastidiosus]WEH11418.1 haloacid dehalogenase type II [Alicyclobacillus fastidiosus]
MAAIVFDAYGTLFDVGALVATATELVGDASDAQEICRTWRSKQLDYAWNSLLMNRFMDFDKATEAALKFALRDASVDEGRMSTLVPSLLEAHDRLPLFDDVRSTLEALGEHHKLLILSNGTFRALQTLTNAQGILFSLDYILSTEPIRTYKPTRAAYQIVLDTLTCDKADVVFVSSNHWDVTGAKAFGFKTYWCNRTGQVADPIPPQPDGVMASLADLTKLL